MSRSISALILNYNAGESILACIEALEKSVSPPLPILVVDNGSSDGSLEAVESRFPSLEILRLGENRGYAGGMNAGLRHLQRSGVRRFLLLNPDTVVSPGFLVPLEEALAAGAAVAGPKLILPDQPSRIWCAGGRVTFGLNLSQLRGHRQWDRGQFDVEEDVGFLPATVWLLDEETLEEVGLFDERFFCYVEDVDYCVRLAGAGRRIRYAPRSVVVHEGSQASGGGYTELRKYLNALGSWELLRKHGTLRRWASFLVCDVLTLPLALCYGLLRRRPGAALGKVRGMLDGFLGRSFTPERRSRLMQRAGR